MSAEIPFSQYLTIIDDSVTKVPADMIHIAPLVNAERDRQEKLAESGKFPCTCADPEMPFDERLAVLTEEVGEVASAYQSFKAGKPDNLADELTQVAAVCVAWLESIGWSRGDVIVRVCERASQVSGTLAGMVALLGLVVTAASPEHVIALEDLAAEAVSWLSAMSQSIPDA